LNYHRHNQRLSEDSMMRSTMAVFVLTASLAGGASGQQACPCGGGTQVVAVAALLSGKTVCASVPGGDSWQEYHDPSHALWDYKKGPGDPVDPSKQVGTWNVALEPTVTYSYTGGNSYSFTVCQAAAIGPYSFCGPTNIFNATLKAGQTSCP
jgi:hypothetical protein